MTEAERDGTYDIGDTVQSLALILGSVAASGTAGTAALFAQAPADTAGIAPYVGGGAGVIAVAALAEVCRRLLNGRLIPREIRDAEAEVQAYIIAAGQREDRAMQLVAEANQHLIASAKQTEAVAEEARQMRRAIEDLTDKIRRDQ